MTLRIRGFTTDQGRDLQRSIRLVHERLRHPPGPMPRDLHSAIQDILAGHRPIVDLVFGGDQGPCREPYARSAGYRILLCGKAFRPEAGTGRARLPAVLFHEFIHIARGLELDAEAFENAWFSAGEGATPPTREDRAVFKEDHYQGWWVRLDPRTRRVTDYADRPILTFPAPLPRRG